MTKKDDRLVIWPVYFDADRTRTGGRAVSKSDAVHKPTVDEVHVAAMELNLEPTVEREKRYPSLWWDNMGRILVRRRGPKTVLLRDLARTIRRIRG